MSPTLGSLAWGLYYIVGVYVIALATRLLVLPQKVLKYTCTIPLLVQRYF